MTNEERWLQKISSTINGRTIKSVRYMTTKEMEENGWYSKALIIQLDDGNLIWPGSDDEGNSAGSLFTTFNDLSTIPAI